MADEMLPHLGRVIYHRKGNDTTQTDEDARRILASGELWGTRGRYSATPAVRAYRGPLLQASWGIEFTTEVSPDRHGIPNQPTWSGPRPGVVVQGETARIKVTVTRIRFRDGGGYCGGKEDSDE